MEIHRKNHTRPTDNYTHRIQVDHQRTKNFKVSLNDTGNLMIEARCADYDWQVTLSKEEVAQLSGFLAKES